MPNALKAFRKKHAIKQDELCKICKVSLKTVQNYEQGRNPIPGPITVLLQILDLNPHILQDMISQVRK